MKTKSCAKCWIEKPIEDFYTLNGSYCKKCICKLSSDWQKNNPEENRAKGKRWRSAHPDKAKELDRRNNERRKKRNPT
jgi:hypothetical protein